MQHQSGKWPSLEQLQLLCQEKPMTRQLKKSVMDRIPPRLEKKVQEWNIQDSSEANDYMTLIRGLTSLNKHKVQQIQNDLIIYLEVATLRYDTAFLLTNDNLFYNSVGRYPLVLNTIITCAQEEVEEYNKHHDSVQYIFTQFTVCTTGCMNIIW